MGIKDFAAMGCAGVMLLALALHGAEVDKPRGAIQIIHGEVVQVEAQQKQFTVKSKEGKQVEVQYDKSTQFMDKGKPSTAERVLKQGGKVSVTCRGTHARRVEKMEAKQGQEPEQPKQPKKDDSLKQ